MALFSLQLLFALKAFGGVSAIVPRWEEALKYCRSKLIAVSLLLVEWTGFMYFWCAAQCQTDYIQINTMVVTAVVLLDVYFAYVLYSCCALGSEGRIDIANNQVLGPGHGRRVQHDEPSDGLFVARDVEEAGECQPGKLPPVQVGIPVVDWTQNRIEEHDI